MSIINSEGHDSEKRSLEGHHSEGHASEVNRSQSDSLEALVRIALLNKELAPGVAKQINAYRSETLNTYQTRLLAILDDAIADQYIVIIEPADQPLPQSVIQPTAAKTEQLALHYSIPSL